MSFRAPVVIDTRHQRFVLLASFWSCQGERLQLVNLKAFLVALVLTLTACSGNSTAPASGTPAPTPTIESQEEIAGSQPSETMADGSQAQTQVITQDRDDEANVAPSKESSNTSNEEIERRRQNALAVFDAQAPNGVTSGQRDAAMSMAARAKWAVVEIVAGNVAAGTGTFITPDGYVITAGHVVMPNMAHSITTYDGRQFPANLIAYNSSYSPDIALLKVDGDGFPFVSIGSTPSIGDLAIAVGHPAGLLWATSGGVITGIDTSQSLPLIEYTNPSDKGASGSAILNLEGDLIGLVSGQRGFKPPASVIADARSTPLWNALEFHNMLDNRGFGPTGDVVANFLNQNVAGLVEKSRSRRSEAVTVNTSFVAPQVASNLCRICLHWGGLMDWISDYIFDIPPVEQVRYLEMMAASMQDPTNLENQDQDKIQAVGKSIQSAVVALSVNAVGGESNAGTGFFISPDGYLLTNAHIVESAKNVEITRLNGSQSPGVVVGSVPQDWVPDLALIKVSGPVDNWIPLSDEGILDELVVGVGHPQSLEWAIYGGRMSYWDPPPRYIEVSPHFQFDAVNVGVGSSGSPVVNMRGELVGVLADGIVDKTFSEQWTYGVSDFVDSVVFWDQASLNAAIGGRVGGPRIDAVKEFIEARVPGLVAKLQG